MRSQVIKSAQQSVFLPKELSLPGEYTAVSLYIAESPISGLGLFSEEDLVPNQLLLMTGFYLLSRSCFTGSVQRTSSEHILEPRFVRWLNHSCRPNVTVVFWGNLIGLKTVSWVSHKTELVCDYMDTEDRIPIPFMCRCSACASLSIKRVLC